MKLINVTAACLEYLSLTLDKHATANYINYLSENGNSQQQQYEWLLLKLYQDLDKAVLEQKYCDQLTEVPLLPWS